MGRNVPKEHNVTFEAPADVADASNRSPKTVFGMTRQILCKPRVDGVISGKRDQRKSLPSPLCVEEAFNKYWLVQTHNRRLNCSDRSCA